MDILQGCPVICCITNIIINSKNPKKILPIEIMGYNENYFQ
jgi:hypothetical protein